MSYVVESGSSRRARRRRRTAITLLIVVAGLAGAFKVAASYYQSGPPATASGCPTAKATTGPATAKPGAKPAATKAPVAAPALAPSQVTVNVYNATSRAGLAADTAKLVKARGYVVGTVANDPLNKAVAGPAEIRFGPNGAAAGALVRKLITGSVPVTDARADASVDLVLGTKFSALAPALPSAVVSPNC